MKTRHGFVSNSSSSSFIIALSRKPETEQELHTWMFPKGPERVQPYDEGFSSAEIAEAAFRDFTRASVMTFEEVVEELSSGTVIGETAFPEYPHNTWNLPDEDRNKAWEDYSLATKAAAEKVAISMRDTNPDALFVKVEYSDNDGSFYTCMEHGDVFSNLSHVRISHH